jgi:phenylpyruvate tautomerase PptA (4-oxalocrotonate tautomerase family)
MPLIKINILKGFSPEYKKKLTDVIHSSLVDAIRIPEHDRNQLICEYEKENFDVHSFKSEKGMIVEIVLFSGRSAAAKKELYRLMTDRLFSIMQIDPLDVFIVLNESPLENWGIRGGKQASEVNLGFKVDV